MARPFNLDFNEAYYLKAHPDVAAAVAAGQFTSGRQHWELYGKAEGRAFTPYLDLEVYAAKNPDLKAAGITSDADLVRHFATFGINENRNFFSSSVFNAEVYAANNPDLKAAGITSEAALAAHFRDFGMAEGRMASSAFDPKAYAAANADLAAAGITSDAALRAHFYTFGQFEGRPGTQVFTLTGALKTLSDAEKAKVEFLKGLDLDDNEATPTTETDVANGATTAMAAVDAIVAGDYTGSSAGVRAALMADQVKLNGDNLTKAKDTLTKAQAEVAKVAGLTDATAKLAAAKDVTKAATEAQTEAGVNLVAADAAYEARNGNTPITVAADGTVTGLIELKDGKLVLVTNITEKTNPGVTALLNASIAKENADKAVVDATTAQTAAQKVVNDLDLTAGAKTALANVAGAMTVVKLAEGAMPTASQIQTEVTGLQALATTAQTTADATNAVALRATSDAAATAVTTVTTGVNALKAAISGVTFGADEATTEGAVAALTADAVTDGFISAADKTAIDTAFNDALTDAASLTAAVTAATGAADANNNINERTATATAADAAADAAEAADTAAADAAQAVTDFQNLVNLYNTAAATNPLAAALETAQTGVKTAEDAIKTLTEKVADLTNAQALVTELGKLNDAIDAAKEAFTDNDFTLPVTVSAGSNLATASSDIFVAGSADGSITNFGLLGDDSLYIGSDYTLNTNAEGKNGNNSVLEVFLIQDGNDTKVVLETETWSSNSTDDEVVITLVGVSVDDLKLDNGLITIG